MKLEYMINHALPLRDFIKNLDISDKLLADIKNNGEILINGEHVTIRYQLKQADYLQIIFPEEKRGKQLTASNVPLDIIYEDEYLLVINKPPLIPCIPDHRYHEETLANRLIGYYQKIELSSTVHFVNRLDRETSGLLIIAKYRYIHHLLSKSHIERKYLALVKGKLSDITIDLPIGRKDKNVKREIMKTGKASITHCCTLEFKGTNSLMECQLETGRTHQIRVHLAALNHPLIGDTLYNGTDEYNTYYLHSHILTFIHPITKERLHFKSERSIEEYLKTAL